MVEWRGGWTMGGKPISNTVMAAFELDAHGRINQWRESYDLKSITDQIEAAGHYVPDARQRPACSASGARQRRAAANWSWWSVHQRRRRA
jgi:hypothetical protein